MKINLADYYLARSLYLDQETIWLKDQALQILVSHVITNSLDQMLKDLKHNPWVINSDPVNTNFIREIKALN